MRLRETHRPLLLLIFAIALAACGKSEKAQQELARSNIEYTESSFIDNARQGNADAVKLFLDAGMNAEVKTRDGQTALMVAAQGDGKKYFSRKGAKKAF